MKKKLFTLFLISTLFLVALAAFASAQVTMTVENDTLETLPSNDGTNLKVIFNFDLESTFLNDTDVTIKFSETTGDLNDWNPTLSEDDFTLGDGDDESFTLTFTVPKYESDGESSGVVEVLDGSNTVLASSVITVDVQESPSLKFTTLNKLSKSANDTTVTLLNNGNVDLADVRVYIDNGGTNDNKIVDADNNKLEVSFEPSDTFALDAGDSREITIKYLEDADEIDLVYGNVNQEIKAESSEVTEVATLQFENDFCEIGEINSDSDIEFKISDVKGDGEEDNGKKFEKWNLLEEVEIEVEVDNTGDAEEDFTVSLLIYDPTSGKELYDDELDISIEDDEEDSVTFTFEVPAETDDDSIVLIKVFVDEEDEECVSTWSGVKFADIEVDSKENHDIGFSDLSLESNPTFCGDSVVLSAEAHNIGKKDEDRVLLRVLNKDLELDKELLLFDLDEGDDDDFEFVFDVPSDLEEKTYNIELIANYEYSKSGGAYGETKRQLVALRVDGGCTTSPGSGSGSSDSNVLITASLSSDAVAGESLVVSSTLRNLGSEVTSFTVIPFNYESWSSLESTVPSSVTLLPGESRDVKITLIPKENSAGENSFTIRALFDDQLVDQPVSVFISGSKGSGDGFSLSGSLKDNLFIWIIVLANIILIIVIIIVAVRISRR